MLQLLLFCIWFEFFRDSDIIIELIATSVRNLRAILPDTPLTVPERFLQSAISKRLRFRCSRIATRSQPTQSYKLCFLILPLHFLITFSDYVFQLRGKKWQCISLVTSMSNSMLTPDCSRRKQLP